MLAISVLRRFEAGRGPQADAGTHVAPRARGVLALFRAEPKKGRAPTARKGYKARDACSKNGWRSRQMPRAVSPAAVAATSCLLRLSGRQSRTPNSLRELQPRVVLIAV